MPTIVLLVALIGLALPDRASAYLDPGTGSAILQMAMAAILGTLFVIKTYWRKLMSFFSSKPIEEEERPDATGSAASSDRDT